MIQWIPLKFPHFSYVTLGLIWVTMSSKLTKQCFWLPFLFSTSLLFQHRWRVRAYGRRRSHIQGVPHPSQEPEGPGCWGGHHSPKPRHQARDLVGSNHQLLDKRDRWRSYTGIEFYDFWFCGTQIGEQMKDLSWDGGLLVIKVIGLRLECICLNVFLWQPWIHVFLFVLFMD